MATLLMLDGAEHGRMVSPAAYDGVTGTPAAVTTPVHSGARALEIATAAAIELVSYNLPASTRLATMAFYIRFASLPAGDVVLAHFVNAAGNPQFAYDQSSNRFKVMIQGASEVQDTTVVAIDTWYRIVLEATSSADPQVIRATVNGGTEISTSTADTPTDITSARLGCQASSTFTAYYDDWLISVTDGDFEEIDNWVSHEVESLIPTSDGTHNTVGANEIERTATGTDITDATTDAYTLVDDRPLDVTSIEYINDVGTSATAYCEMLFENLTSSLTNITGVRGLTVDRESTNTGASSAVSRVVLADGTSVAPDLRLSTDDPGVTVTVRKKLLTAPGGSWDTTEVNGLRVRCGFGDGAPDVWFCSFMLEVALYEPAAASPGTSMSIIMAGV